MRLSSAAIESETLEMRLFELAKRLSPIKADEKPITLPEKLKIRPHLVIPSNPWETYLNLRKDSPHRYWKFHANDLPNISIRDFDLPEDSEAEESEQSAHQTFDMLTEIQNSVKTASEQDRAELSSLGASLTKLSAQIRESEASAALRLIGLRTKLNILLWLLAAILVLLALKFR